MREVAQYIYERDAATVQIISAAQSQIVLSLTHSLDTTVCDFSFPLTLKTEVAATWDSVTVMQGGSTTIVTSVTDSGKQYVYFDARPNKGQIILSVGGGTAVPQHPVNRQIETTSIPGLNPIKAEVLRHYLVQQKDALIYDMTGKIINPETLDQPGLYLVWKAESRQVKKVMVVR